MTCDCDLSDSAYLQEHLSIQQLIVVSHKIPPVVTVQDLRLFFPLLRGCNTKSLSKSCLSSPELSLRGLSKLTLDI